ncbi:MAG: HrpJ domain-containing protein [Simkaniaceae bacterium]|nr:HrpJ domain-containing protein [Simkaniaceae bacterium]
MAKVEGTHSVSQAHMHRLEQKKAELQAQVRQEATQNSVKAAFEMSIYNPMEFNETAKKFEERKAREALETPTGKDADELGFIESKAKAYEARNPELKSRTLIVIRENLNENDTIDILLGKIRGAYADAALADEAIDFLIETSENNKVLQEKLTTAKEKFNIDYGREIRAGRNIQEEAQSFSKQGLGTPTGLRDLYRDITGNPRDPHTLFVELNTKFSFEEMLTVIAFVLHSLGSDMKSKGPSIEPAELQRLFTEARTMQSIVGVYRFFKGRMDLIKKEFSRFDLNFPKKITFEMLAKIFMQMIQDRYPSVNKVIGLARLLGISEEEIAQIIIFSQYRDAMRNVSPRLFANDKQRQGLLMTLIEALSELEEEEEEEEENTNPNKDTLE